MVWPLGINCITKYIRGMQKTTNLPCEKEKNFRTQKREIEMFCPEKVQGLQNLQFAS